MADEFQQLEHESRSLDHASSLAPDASPRVDDLSSDSPDDEEQGRLWVLSLMRAWRMLPWWCWCAAPEDWNEAKEQWLERLDQVEECLLKKPDEGLCTLPAHPSESVLQQLIEEPTNPETLVSVARDAEQVLDGADPGFYTSAVMYFCYRLAAESGDYNAIEWIFSGDRSIAERTAVFEKDPDRRVLAELMADYLGLTMPATLDDEPEPSTHVVFKSMLEPDDRESKARMALFTELHGKPLELAGNGAFRDCLETLEPEMPWMRPVSTELGRQLALESLRGSGVVLRPMLLVGPPGTGKSHLARRLGELLGLPTLVIPAAGCHDNMLLTGTARGYGTARASHLLRFIAEHQVANPLVVVDEIDKVTSNSQWGSVLDSLHDFLEPENAAHWTDQFLLGETDLSRVSWIATANDINQLPASLRSRFRVVTVDMPTPEHRNAMLHAICKQVGEEYGLGASAGLLFEELDWQWLESVADTPRRAKRAIEALLGIKVRNAVAYSH